MLSYHTVYPFKTLPPSTKVADIGGGVGNVSIELAKAYPHLNITLQDLEGPIEDAKKLWDRDCPQAIEDERIEFVAKSFFDGVVEGQDIYYVRLEACAQLRLLLTIEMTDGKQCSSVRSSTIGPMLKPSKSCRIFGRSWARRARSSFVSSFSLSKMTALD